MLQIYKGLQKSKTSSDKTSSDEVKGNFYSLLYLLTFFKDFNDLKELQREQKRETEKGPLPKGSQKLGEGRRFIGVSHMGALHVEI